MGQDLIRDGKLDRQAATEALRRFLEEIVRVSGLDLEIAVRAVEPSRVDASGDAEVIADLDGRDKEILLERNGEVLKAFEHLAFRALRLEPTYHEKIHLDSGGYRALRFEELRMTARVAAERVQSSHQPFRLNPMSSRAAHCAFGAERNARSAHRKRGHGRRAPSGDPSGQSQVVSLASRVAPEAARSYSRSHPCERTAPDSSIFTR
jgi:hypothetical protein